MTSFNLWCSVGLVTDQRWTADFECAENDYMRLGTWMHAVC